MALKTKQVDLVVIGAGPGGYAAAFYAADCGQSVLLIEKNPRLGGVCLNYGCIPSKALLHATETITEAEESNLRGVTFGKPKIDLKKLYKWKDSIVDKLSSGIGSLAKARKVEVLAGRAYFESDNTLRVETKKGQEMIEFNKAIVAVGSQPILPAAFDLGNKRIMTSKEALEIEDIPKKLLVVGGGYIGMELGTVYAKFGSNVDVVEAMPAILAGADPDIVRPVKRRVEQLFNSVRLDTKVLSMATKGKQVQVEFEQDSKKSTELYDKVLVSVGRRPNADNLGLKHANIKQDSKGFIEVDETLKTSNPNVYAIGDIAGGILLAHKASRDARIAVDAILGNYASNKDIVIPAVVFTDPEVAWCGITETEAKDRGIKVNVAKFPWGALGRALTLDRPEGLTKLILEPETDRVLGVAMVGSGAGDMIAEGTLAVESGLTAKDLALTVHPHPTLSESMMEAAEVFYGHATHVNSPKRK